MATAVLVTGGNPTPRKTPELASGVFAYPPKICWPILYTPPHALLSARGCYTLLVQVTSTNMHYKNILHFEVEGQEVLKMDIQGADRVKASEIARHTLMKHPHLFSGREVTVSIEYVYSVPDGSGCVDFEFDVEPMGIYKGPRPSHDDDTPVQS